MSTDSSFSQCTCSATCSDGQNPQHTCYRDGSAPWTPSHVSCRQSSSGPSRSIRQHKSVRPTFVSSKSSAGLMAVVITTKATMESSRSVVTTVKRMLYGLGTTIPTKAMPAATITTKRTHEMTW